MSSHEVGKALSFFLMTAGMALLVAGVGVFLWGIAALAN